MALQDLFGIAAAAAQQDRPPGEAAAGRQERMNHAFPCLSRGQAHFPVAEYFLPDDCIFMVMLLLLPNI
jgi:hypothetical protein